jgi:hypothetical protein
MTLPATVVAGMAITRLAPPKKPAVAALPLVRPD